MNTQEKIKEKHTDDVNQLSVIFSEDPSIVVTAPAGCGKTTTMVSKIAWELSSHHIPPNKKILAMTFSVAGAMKIRDSLKELLPQIIDAPEQLLKQIDVSNYHQFSVKLLNRYGYALLPEMQDLNSFLFINEESHALESLLNTEHLDVLKTFQAAINSVDITVIKGTLEAYWGVLYEYLIPNRMMTYNGLLVSAIMLLQKHENIAAFYQKYYQMIIVDEFQDTNYLGFFFLQQLLGENRSVFMGDDIQRIYGFIGAVENIFSLAINEYGAKQFYFRKNYRFPENAHLTDLDLLVRDYGEKYSSELHADVKFKTFATDASEICFIVEGIEKIINNTSDNVAILVRAGYQGDSISKKLDANGIKYFNSLYKDSDPECERFYNIAVNEFKQKASNGKFLIKDMKACLQAIYVRKDEIIYENNRDYIFNSLYRLFGILFDKSKEWGCTPEERYNLIKFSLDNKGLQHMMEYMNERVILSTVHAAKGLEWQYVIVPGLVSYSFPSSQVCKKCSKILNRVNKDKFCKTMFNPKMEKDFKEELSVFYVALTRAKKEVFFTASTDKNPWGCPKKSSCFISLPGITCVDFSWEEILK